MRQVQNSNELRTNMSIKSFSFNRFLGIRYAQALFFFMNLYWFVLTIGTQKGIAIVPFSLIVWLVLASFEQIRLMSFHKNQLPRAKQFFFAQLIVNICILFLLGTSFFSEIYPFFSNTSQTKRLVGLLLFIGIVMCYLILKHIQKIEKNQDKHYQRMIAYEQTLIEKR